MVVKLHHTSELWRYNVMCSGTKWIIVDFLANNFPVSSCESFVTGKILSLIVRTPFNEASKFLNDTSPSNLGRRKFNWKRKFR